MTGPEVRRLEDGSISLVGLPPWFVAALIELPDLLADDGNEKVRKRLYPDPSDDANQKEEWKRLVVPELFALVASAREVVRADLAKLEPARGRPTEWNVKIPAKHVNAWISALQAGRLALAARHDIGELEMEGRAEKLEEERQLALVKIHLLALVQEMLLDEPGRAPEPPAQAG